jgi:hypothetical protein
MDSSTCKRRRTEPSNTFTISSGPDAPPSPIKNRSLEFTHQQGRNRQFGQTSTSAVVEEAFGQQDVDLPDEPLPWEYDFDDLPLPPSEEGPSIEDEEVCSATFYLAS